MTKIKYICEQKYFPLCKIFQLHLFVGTTSTYEKYINYNKNIALNVNKTMN